MYKKKLSDETIQLIEVEILDYYPPLCSVRALQDCLFVGGLKWPVRTEYGVVKVEDVEILPE